MSPDNGCDHSKYGQGATIIHAISCDKVVRPKPPVEKGRKSLRLKHKKFIPQEPRPVVGRRDQGT